MGRLKIDLLERAERFSHRVLDVAETIERQGRSRRIVDQMAAAGTSVGANVWESDEALSRADFAKSIGVAPKELGETRFWLRLTSIRGWIPAKRLELLMQEAVELRRILGAIVTRTRRGTVSAKRSS